MGTILGLDIWFIAYFTQIFIISQLNQIPEELNLYMFIQNNHIWFRHWQELEMFKHCIGNIWFSTFWAWNLAIQILTWCTRQDDGHWAKLCLGDSFSYLPNSTLSSLGKLYFYKCILQFGQIQFVILTNFPNSTSSFYSLLGEWLCATKSYPSMFCCPTFGNWSIRINNRLV